MMVWAPPARGGGGRCRLGSPCCGGEPAARWAWGPRAALRMLRTVVRGLDLVIFSILHALKQVVRCLWWWRRRRRYPSRRGESGQRGGGAAAQLSLLRPIVRAEDRSNAGICVCGLWRRVVAGGDAFVRGRYLLDGGVRCIPFYLSLFIYLCGHQHARGRAFEARGVAGHGRVVSIESMWAVCEMRAHLGTAWVYFCLAREMGGKGLYVCVEGCAGGRVSSEGVFGQPLRSRKLI